MSLPEHDFAFILLQFGFQLRILHILTEIAIVSEERTCIPNSVFSPIRVLIKRVQNVFPRAIQLVGDRKFSVQDVSQDLYFFTVIFAVCVVESVSKHQNIPISEF